jgi:hypothetical protein
MWYNNNILERSSLRGFVYTCRKKQALKLLIKKHLERLRGVRVLPWMFSN